MRLHALAALAVLVMGCIDPAPDGSGPNGPDSGPRTAGADETVAISALREGEGSPDVCSLLATDVNATCALACAPDADLADWVPPHSCVALVCPLSDGTHATLHGCRE